MRIKFALLATIFLTSCIGEVDEDTRIRLAHEEMRDYAMMSRPVPMQDQVQMTDHNFSADNISRDMFGNPLEADREQDLIAADIRLVNEYLSTPTPLPGPTSLMDNQPPTALSQPVPNYAPLPNIPQPTARPAPATRAAPAPARAAAPTPAPRPAQAQTGRCRSGETWTEMRDGSFACCPREGASCYNPCESGERATRMRDGTFACCPTGGAHCYPL